MAINHSHHLRPGAVCALMALMVMGGLVGCASRSDIDEAQNMIFQLRTSVANQDQQIQRLREELARVSDRIREMDARSGSRATVSPQINAKLAELDQRLGQLETTVSQLQTASTGGESTEGGTAIPPGGTASSGTGAPSQPLSLDAEIDQALNTVQNARGNDANLLRKGLSAMKGGQYETAVKTLELLPKRYPKSQFREAAEYFAGMGLFQLGKYEQSILQFNDVVMRYPKGNYSAQALLNEAQAFLNLNDKIDARLTLEKLMDDHKDAPQAAQARRLMAELSR